MNRRIRFVAVALAFFSASAFGGALEGNQSLPDYAALQAFLKSKKTLTWVVTGDSITHGAKFLMAARSYPELFNERIRWEVGPGAEARRNDVFINTGVSGERVDGLLGAYDFRIGRFHPDFVSVNLGMNDCVGGAKNLTNFRTKLTVLVRKIRAGGAIPVLQIVNPVREGDSRGATLPTYQKAVAEIAAQEKVLSVDHRRVFERMSGKPDTAPARWMGDGIHPNAAGHVEMAKTMLLDLGLFDDRSAVCNLGDHR